MAKAIPFLRRKQKTTKKQTKEKEKVAPSNDDRKATVHGDGKEDNAKEKETEKGEENGETDPKNIASPSKERSTFRKAHSLRQLSTSASSIKNNNTTNQPSPVLPPLAISTSPASSSEHQLKKTSITPRPLSSARLPSLEQEQNMIKALRLSSGASEREEQARMMRSVSARTLNKDEIISRKISNSPGSAAEQQKRQTQTFQLSPAWKTDLSGKIKVINTLSGSFLFLVFSLFAFLCFLLTSNTITGDMLKELLGGDSPKYPIRLDFSSGDYRLESDDFLSACPDVLKELDLTENKLTECNNFHSLSHLKRLILDRNQISSISFQGLSGLKLLSLRSNKLDYMSDMYDLKSLVELNLSGNNISAGFSELSKLKALRVLDLSDNNIQFNLRSLHRNIIQPLKTLPKLQVVRFFPNNPFTVRIPHYRLFVISELPKLQILDDKEITKEEKAEAEKLAAQGQFNEKDTVTLRKEIPQKKETSSASHLNVGGSSTDSGSLILNSPRGEARSRPDLNVSSSSLEADSSSIESESTSSKKNFRPDLNVSSLSDSNIGSDIVVPSKNFRPDLNVSLSSDNIDTKKSKNKDSISKKKSGSYIKGLKWPKKATTPRSSQTFSGGSSIITKEAPPSQPIAQLSPPKSSERTVAFSEQPETPPIEEAQTWKPVHYHTQEHESEDGENENEKEKEEHASNEEESSEGEESEEESEDEEEEEQDVTKRIERYGSAAVLQQVSLLVTNFASAAVYSVSAFGEEELTNLHLQLKELVLGVKDLFALVQSYVNFYPEQKTFILEKLGSVQSTMRGVVVAVKQLTADKNETNIQSLRSFTQELALAMQRLFCAMEGKTLPEVEALVKLIQECALATMHFIQTATGQVEGNLEQRANSLTLCSEKLVLQITVKATELQDSELESKLLSSVKLIDDSIHKVIRLVMSSLSTISYQDFIMNPENSDSPLSKLKQVAVVLSNHFKELTNKVHGIRASFNSAASLLLPTLIEERDTYDRTCQHFEAEMAFLTATFDLSSPSTVKEDEDDEEERTKRKNKRERAFVECLEGLSKLVHQFRDAAFLGAISEMQSLVLRISEESLQQVLRRVLRLIHRNESELEEAEKEEQQQTKEEKKALVDQLKCYAAAIRYYAVLLRIVFPVHALQLEARAVLPLSTVVKGLVYCLVNVAKVFLASSFAEVV
ncbi:U2 small nuclear ribonucleoprotein A' [Balamuthia mandrillaris]